MRKVNKKQKIGLPPGTLLYTGDGKLEDTKIQIFDYSKEEFKELKIDELYEDIKEIKKSHIRWIHVIGLKDIKKIEKLGNLFNLHPLVLEDILSTNQRPKYENYNDYIFMVIRKISLEVAEEDFISEQLGLIFGSNYVISIQEREPDIFRPIIERIKASKGNIRTMGTDYLTYALLDIIIDNYFVDQEILGEIIEDIEYKLIEEPEESVLQSIYNIRRTSIELRKAIWPMRDVINKFQRDNSDLIESSLDLYLRDLYDHIYRIDDSIQNYREIISGMLDMYLSSVSNKMNDIMKILTIISTIFIPLSFLAGFYGMNFSYMPELTSPLAYPILIIIMISAALLMIFFFKKKSWI